MTDLPIILAPHEQVVAYIAAAYAVPSWEPQTLQLYAAELADLPADALKRAAREWVRTRPERPAVSELITATVRMATRIRTEKKRALRRQQQQALIECEPEDVVNVRQLLADVRRRLEHKRSLSTDSTSKKA